MTREQLEQVVLMLQYVAVEVEGAGDFWRAVRLKLITGSSELYQSLRQLIPISRGGTLTHPDADRDWEAMVKRIASLSGADISMIRAWCDEQEPVS